VVTDHWHSTPEELLLAAGAAQRSINAMFAEMFEIVAELESRGIAEARGFRDTADLLVATQNVSLSAARFRSRVAVATVSTRTLLGEAVPAELSAVAAALQEAAISVEHVAVIQRTLASLPPHLGAHRPALEADLVDFSRTLDPDAVAKLGKNALALLDPDGPRPRDGAPTRTRLTFRPRGNGFEAKGWFDQESAAIVRTALSPLTRPTRPTCESEGCSEDCEVAERDQRSTAERTGDGLVELARRAMTQGALGVEGGIRPQVTVTVPLQVLQSGSGAGLIGFGQGTRQGMVTAEDARRWACDPVLVPVVLCDTTGEPLAVGREKRLATRAMRRALAQRDGGCAFPGCDAPPQWCDAHHVTHWADGGATEVGNLVLLCGRHHRLVHKQGWTITMAGGFPTFEPPYWIPGGPRRNMIHRPDLVGAALLARERPPPRVVELVLD
jgi:hypothetical protein